jgi:hypothetical protein
VRRQERHEGWDDLATVAAVDRGHGLPSASGSVRRCLVEQYPDLAVQHDVAVRKHERFGEIGDRQPAAVGGPAQVCSSTAWQRPASAMPAAHQRIAVWCHHVSA